MQHSAWRPGQFPILFRRVCFLLLGLTLLLAGLNVPRRQPLPCRPPSLLSPLAKPGGQACEQAWITFDFDAARSGVNPGESTITPTTVRRLRRLWVHRLAAVSDSAPILLPSLPWPDGTKHDVLYLTTRVGSLVALDASTGEQLWTRTPLVPADPNKMTTSSPVGDPARAVVYSYGMDGKVHQYQAATGQEIRDRGWPVPVTAMRDSEKESSALNAADGELYVTTAGFAGDTPPYQGHLVTIDLAQGTARVFNSLCSRRRHLLSPFECPQNDGGIWARAGAVVDPLTGHLFFATGNGPYTADRDGGNWGDSVLELTRDGTRLLDSFSPPAAPEMTEQDQDLGSSAPALLPAMPASAVPLLAVQAGKEGVLRLLDRQNLSGQGGPGHVGGAVQTLDAPEHCPVLTQPVVWTDPRGGAVWVFVGNGCALSGYQVRTSLRGSTSLRQVWNVGMSATSPILAGGVLFAATSLNGVVALEPQTGRQLWSSADPAAGGTIGMVHWESPIVVGGRLYCSDEQGQISAYGL